MTTPANKVIDPELKSALDALRAGIAAAAPAAKLAALQSQVDALDVKLAQKHYGAPQQKSLAEDLKENESLSKLLKDRKGRAYFELKPSQADALMNRKSIITGVAS